MTLPIAEEASTVGNYFVSNYPPFSFWRRESLPAVDEVLSQRLGPSADVPLGLYLHIPFCRKRCKFCYFRVYTDKNAREVERYNAALAREVELLAERPAIAGRPLRFVYFGGGTPSFLSPRQLEDLVARLRRAADWSEAEEVTFECEPGTLSLAKLEAIRRIGVTRLSLGVENFDDRVLEENGRAHRSPEIYKAYQWAKGLDFDQINIDLIAGMVGETWENWKDCVRRTLELAPDSITIYQMELPYNTIYSKEVLQGKPLVADWKTKREWVDYAFDELGRAGYRVSSAYTLVKDPETRFVYRDALWRGADLLGTGVASFSQVGGVHFQNLDTFDEYLTAVEEGGLPLRRALRMTEHQRFIREWILQLKLGVVEASYFRRKFGIDPLEEYAEVLSELEERGYAACEGDRVRLTRRGLLRVDALLPAFFEPEHRGARYT